MLFLVSPLSLFVLSFGQTPGHALKLLIYVPCESGYSLDLASPSAPSSRNFQRNPVLERVQKWASWAPNHGASVPPPQKKWIARGQSCGSGTRAATSQEKISACARRAQWRNVWAAESPMPGSGRCERREHMQFHIRYQSPCDNQKRGLWSHWI